MPIQPFQHFIRLCVFNMSNDVAYTNSLSNMSLIYDADRAGLQEIIMQDKLEERILQEHALIQNLSNDLPEIGVFIVPEIEHLERRADDRGTYRGKED